MVAVEPLRARALAKGQTDKNYLFDALIARFKRRRCDGI